MLQEFDVTRILMIILSITQCYKNAKNLHANFAYTI